MEFFSWNDTARILNTNIPSGLPKENSLGFTAISTDTRTITPGSLFVAVKGERFDGHNFLETALQNGAVAAIINKDTACRLPLGLPCFRVSNTLDALLSLAGAYRNRFNIPVVGVTGSVGKTTTKEMIALALSGNYNVLKTSGNLNNNIGVPATLFSITKEHSAAVIEMGMNHFDEISVLSLASRPTIGVITNIGFSHIEFLGSQEGIRQAKLEILDGMQPNTPLILNADDALLKQVAELGISSNHPLLYYSINPSIDNAAVSVKAEDIREDNQNTYFTISWNQKHFPAMLPCIGHHNVSNALAAFLAGVSAGATPEQVILALKQYQTVGMRQKIVQKKEQTVILDCYNSSPDSVKSALEVLSSITPPPGGRRVAVLADMLELGDLSQQLHSNVGEMVVKYAVDTLVCYGKYSAYTAATAEANGLHSGCTTDPDVLLQYLKDILFPGDVVLFKGSRGMKLEEIVNRLYEKQGE